MMRAIFDNPFEAEGRWFKGNLHTHTLNSDGQLSVEQQVTRYKEAGYDFLSITDHGILTDTKKFSTFRFLLIPGEEICVGFSEAGRFIHIVGINVRGEIPVDDFDREGDPQKVIDLIRELGDMYDSVESRPVAIVCAIGSNIAKPGILAKAAKALADAGVNIISVAQTARQTNMQFTMVREDFVRAQQALHAELCE